MSFAQPPAALLYPHRATVYRSQENLAASGKPGPLTQASKTEDVALYFQTGESVKGPNGFVLGEQDNMFTLDIGRFPLTADIQVGDILVQTTGPEVGRVFQARGDEKVRSQFGQYKLVRLSREPKLPEWVEP